MNKELLQITKPFNLLYVEDDTNLRIQMGKLFAILFNHVHIAQNGEEGLKLYMENGDIDLIITDINMPVMNGIEMAKEIKKHNSNIHINELPRCKQRGINAVLTYKSNLS